MKERLNVLFLCTGNSARPILAESYLNARGADRLRAFSAGSRPTGRVNPHAVDLLASLGFDVSALRSKSWDEFAAPGAPHIDIVVTVCSSAAGEVCPIWPGNPVKTHLGVDDPASVTGSAEEKRLAFEQAYALLSTRIDRLLELQLAETEREQLKAQLDGIGAS
jgi:protein-tyrosine-phosphatase